MTRPTAESSLLVAPRNSAERKDFEAWCVDAHIWYGPRLGLGLVLALLLWWPTDVLVYEGMPTALASMREFRLRLGVLLALASLGLPWVPLARRWPLSGTGVLAVLTSALGGWHMAVAGGSAPFWFAFGYVLPVFSVAFLTPLGPRAAIASLMSVAAVCGFALGPGEAFEARELRAAVSYLGFSTLMAIALGHAVYLLVRTGFLMRRRVEQQRESLAELTQSLEQRVAEQTGQLRVLHRQSQEAGAEQRRLVARDLHDGLGQELSSVRLLVGVGRNLSAEPAPREIFEELDGLVERLQLSLRSVLEALQPRLLHEQSVVDALGGLLTETERRWGLRCTAEFGEMPPQMPASASAALFFIAQEALHNVLRHAKANRVTIRLVHEGAWLRLDVEDNGRGIGAESAAGRGMTHIRERARELGGLATWTTTAGTLLSVRLPLETA